MSTGCPKVRQIDSKIDRVPGRQIDSKIDRVPGRQIETDRATERPERFTELQGS